MEKKHLFIWILCLLVVLIAGSAVSDEYKIGTGDVIEIRFWQDNDLNTEVRVNQEGMITLDIIGSIRASGKTTNELQNDIVHQMSRLDARISQVIVRILEYNYQHVFIKGQITTPGKYSFEQIPDLWTLINEAGGLTEFGDLSRVTIIRGGDKSGEIEIVDVAGALARGELDKLPEIGRQDTIEIPRNPVGLPSADLSQQVQKKNVIYVIGAVNTPGPIQYEDNIDILEALSLAGGPTASADLSDARVVTKDGLYAKTLSVDLEKYTTTGSPARYILGKEDTFILPNRQDSFLRRNVGTIATVLGIVTSAIIIYDQLQSDNNGSGATAP